MSDLLNKASLVMVPSGYKEDTVYSVVPTDGSGDLAFTRASNGTRVNSAGLVEVCPWNLVTYSEQFTQYPPWLIQNITRADNVTTAPNGTTTAGKIYPSTTSSNPVMYTLAISVVSGQNYAVSIYAKAAGKNWIFIRTVDDSSAGVWFNLSTGAVGTQTSATGTIESVGNGWYRCTVIGAPTTTTGRCVYLVVDSNGSTTGTASGTDGIFVWGAQLNIGSTAKPYFPTTDRLNVPRLTYQNGGGGCPSLLLEKQSTNLALYSNALSTSPNIAEGSTATENIYISPDGTQNAIRLTETTVNDIHGFYQYNTVSAQTYTASVWTKQTGRRYIAFYSDFTGSATASYFDLQTISVVSSGSGHTCSIQDFGNGWFRLIVTLTATAGSKFVFWGGSNNGSSVSYAGSTSISQTFYGYQLEASSYPTSYIPTTSSSATRVRDAVYKTGISSLIGQTAGTIFLEMTPVGLVTTYTERLIKVYGGGQEIGLQRYADSRLVGYGYLGGASNEWTFDIANVFTSTTQSVKIAMAYASNDVVIYVNGVQKGTDSSASMFSLLSAFTFAEDITGDLVCPQNIKQAVIFKSRLTNAELASITTI